MADLVPCQHLDYEDRFIDCEIRTCAPHYPDVRYWERTNPPYPEAPTRVQFCKKRGRISGIFDCYEAPGPMSCHEPVIEENKETLTG